MAPFLCRDHGCRVATEDGSSRGPEQPRTRGKSRVGSKQRSNPYRRPDHFTREARERGYPARSVAKLEEIDRRVRLLRPGLRVLDLGAAPGSWSLYAAQRIGATGRLLAVDLQPLRTQLPPQATFAIADVFAAPLDQISIYAPYDLVLSDMAPRTTGMPAADQAQSFDLFARSLELAATLLRPGGNFVGKIFMGPDFPEAKRRVKALFATERAIRSEATRGSSFELFLLGLSRRLASPA
jgi:23S rRNA (uridine2552-2'-O)-methyltransferase